MADLFCQVLYHVERWCKLLMCNDAFLRKLLLIVKMIIYTWRSKDEPRVFFLIRSFRNVVIFCWCVLGKFYHWGVSGGMPFIWVCWNIFSPVKSSFLENC